MEVLDKVSSSIERFEKFMAASSKNKDKKMTFPTTPPLARREQTGSLVCYNYKGLGHISRFCPFHDRRLQQNPSQGNGQAGQLVQGQP